MSTRERAPSTHLWDGRSLVGQPTRKFFARYGTFNGTVTGFDESSKQFTVRYEDGDEEDMSLSQLQRYLLADAIPLAVKARLRAEEAKERRKSRHTCERACASRAGTGAAVPGSEFEVGDNVKAHCQKYPGLWPAVIVEIIHPPTLEAETKYVVKWAEEPQIDCVKRAADMRKMKEAEVEEEEEERGQGEEKLRYSLKAPWERNEAREPTTHAEDDWEEGLARLREYQALHGHACPRDKDRKGDKLARKSERFARRQREDFKAGTLTKEREAKLLDMGFIFDGKQAQAVRDEYEAARQQEQQLSSGAEDDWEEGLARLREYQALHGHACPRWRDESAGRFANNQRKRFKAGTLTKEREAKLLDMGFIFDGKQAQAVRDEYEAARLNGGKQAEAVRDDPTKPKLTGKRGRDGDKGGLCSADIAGQMQRTVAVGTRVEVLYTVKGEHKWFAGTVAAAGAPDERVVRARKQTDRFASCKMEGQTYVCADGAQNGADAAGDTHISNTCSAADDAAEAGTRSLWQVLFDDGDEDTITWPDPSGDVQVVPSREGGNAEKDKDILKSGDRKKDSDGVSSSGKGKESMSETHPDMDVDDKSDGVSSMPVDRASGCKRQCSCSLGCSACVKTARVTPAKREARLKEAKELFEKGLIHLRDYDQKKAEILSSL